MMMVAFKYIGDRVEINMGTYSVSDDTYTIRFFDNTFLEDVGFAGQTVAGTWTANDGVLTLYPNDSNNVIRYRRV